MIQLGKQYRFCWRRRRAVLGMACEFGCDGRTGPLYHNDTPESVLYSGDAHRDGFVIAGGGGMVVVEELEVRLWRAVGAHIYAEIVGLAARNIRMAQTWLLRLVKAQYVVFSQMRCTA